MRRFSLALALAAPAFFAPLASAETIRMTEGGTTAEIVLSDAAAAYPTFALFLRDDAEAAVFDLAAEGARTVTVRDRATVAGERFTSIRREVEADLGAASAYRQIDALTWDREAQDFVRLDAFFDAGASRDEALIAISHHVREAIKALVWGGAVDGVYQPLVLQATNPDPAVLANFTLGRSGLTFHYSPREIAPLAKGAPSISVPRAVFEAFLNAAGREAFR
ncbi:MAG: RsiV family protein [Pseudomonadota bacterium]